MLAIVYTFILSLGALVVPAIVYAAPTTFEGLVSLIVRDIINNAFVPLVFGLAFITFLWGIFKFFFFPDEENKRKGRAFLVWGLLGMVVMISVWGLVAVVLRTFSISP